MRGQSAPAAVDAATLAAERRLPGLARASIRHALRHGTALTPNLAGLPAPLREPGASFVSLWLQGALRGCIGSLQALRPLAEDVCENACRAAFDDPRFPPLRGEEAPALRIHVSVLSPPEALVFNDERALLAALQPGRDGLSIACDGHRATFLPLVWAQFNEPGRFLEALKRKAGLPTGTPCPGLRAWRYTTRDYEAPAAPA